MPCEFCDDTGWKPIEQNGIRRVVRCDCRRDEGRSGTSSRLEHSEALPALHDRELYGVQRIARTRRRQRALRLRTHFPWSSRGLFLEGQPGVGKTHLAVAVLKQVIQSTGARGVFYDTRDLLRVIRSTYDPSIRTTELEVLRPVMTADLLVLDDLGAEKTSEWVEETMNLIVNTRYNERRLTIFTSNYEDIPDDTDPNSLLFRIGHRMRSRLHEMCDFVVMDGADYREMPVNGGVDDSDHVVEDPKAAASSRTRRSAGACPASRARPRRPRRPQVARGTGGILVRAIQLRLENLDLRS